MCDAGKALSITEVLISTRSSDTYLSFHKIVITERKRVEKSSVYCSQYHDDWDRVGDPIESNIVGQGKRNI